MALIAIKCPNCGGTFPMEEDLTSGFCVHCGSKIVKEQNVGGQVPVDKGSDLTYRLKLAKESLIAHEWEAATGLVEDILLKNADCRDAWYMKALLHHRDAASEDLIAKAESGGKKSFGIFSKEDISKCWGECTLNITYERSKNTMLTVKARVTVDGKETIIMMRGESAAFGVNAGKHDISAVFIVKNGTTEGDKLSFIATKYHEFVIKTKTSFVYIDARITQLS